MDTLEVRFRITQTEKNILRELFGNVDIGEFCKTLVIEHILRHANSDQTYRVKRNDKVNFY